MPGRQAKLLTTAALNRALKYATTRRYGERNRVMILLSAKAGLRACEIAGLTWGMVLTASGRVCDHLHIEDRISKRGRGRRIPMNRDLRRAIVELKQLVAHDDHHALIQSERGGKMSPGSVVNWFQGVYTAIGLDGCTSHSGRRTFITNASRAVARAGGSLRDVQELAGHASIGMTERYIEGDRHVQRRIIDRI